MTGDRECLHEVPAEAVILRPLGKLAVRTGDRLLAMANRRSRFLRLLRNHQDDILRCFATIRMTSDSEFTRMISIKVPPLGESIVEATVQRWLKKEGEAVAVGDTLVELETDKITVEVTAMNAGVVKKIAHGEGDVVKVDELLAEIDDTATAAAPAPAPHPHPPRHRHLRSRRNPRTTSTAAPLQLTFAHRPPRSAWRQSAVVDLATVQGTGRGGVVSKPDVIERGTPAAKPEPIEFVRVKEPLRRPSR